MCNLLRRTLAVGSSLSASNIQSATANSDLGVRFYLSPNTRISITFNIDVQADSVPGESQFDMMIAGLLVAGAAGWRRRRAAKQA